MALGDVTAPPRGRPATFPAGRLAGLAALGFVLAVLGTAGAGLFSATGARLTAAPLGYVQGILAFTLWQATLSTLISLGLGGTIALALARRTRFPGRGLLMALLNLAIVLPVIVAVLGIVAVFGRSGYLNAILGHAGLGTGRHLYGLPGILIAHVFFNAPLAARIFLAGLAAVPAERWRMASHLGMPPLAVFRLIDWPVLRREAAGAGALIFLLCFTSFAAVLALGGGPRSSTMEVAIYEALRFQADFSRAGWLAAVQISVCAAILMAIFRTDRRLPEFAETTSATERPDRLSVPVRLLDGLALSAAVLFIGAPIAAVALRGIAHAGLMVTPSTLAALATSLAIALPTGALACVLALGLSALSRQLMLEDRRPGLARLVRLGGVGILAVPPFALAAGLFVVARPHINPFTIAGPMIVLVNTLMALPFAMRLLEPPMTLAAERYGRLCSSLGISGLARLRLADWPLLARPLLIAFTLATALSLGDLGVAAFFGTGGLVTLPLLLYQQLGAYRTDAAAATGLLLAFVVLALFIAAHHLSRRA